MSFAPSISDCWSIIRSGSRAPAAGSSRRDHLLERLLGRAAGPARRLDEMRMVQRDPVVPDGRRDRRADRAGRDPDEVGQAARGRDPLRRQPDSVSVTSGMKKNAIAIPCTSVGSSRVVEVGLRVEAGPHPEDEREHEERERRIDPRIDADGRCGRRAATAPSRTVPPAPSSSRPGRRVAHVLLQPQRQQHDVAEEQAVADRDRHRAGPEVAPRRTGSGRRSDASRSAPRRGRGEGDHQRHRQGDDERRAEPVEFLALVEHDLHRADPEHQQRQADAVDRQLARRRLALARRWSRCRRAASSPTGMLM